MRDSVTITFFRANKNVKRGVRHPDEEDCAVMDILSNHGSTMLVGHGQIIVLNGSSYYPISNI